MHTFDSKKKKTGQKTNPSPLAVFWLFGLSKFTRVKNNPPKGDFLHEWGSKIGFLHLLGLSPLRGISGVISLRQNLEIYQSAFIYPFRGIYSNGFKTQALTPSPEPPSSFKNETLMNFESLWQSLTLEFFGREIPFALGPKFPSEKKLKIVQKILENLAPRKIDLGLFLRSHFELSRQKPRLLMPNALASSQALLRYEAWLENYSSPRDARSRSQEIDLEDFLQKSHARFCYYRNEVGWPPETIFKLKAREFNAFYLISCPEFLDFYDVFPDSLLEETGKNIQRALDSLKQSPALTQAFWKLVNRIKRNA